MSQTKYDEINAYKSKYLDNSRVEWLIEHGVTRDTVYFKGETGNPHRRCEGVGPPA